MIHNTVCGIRPVKSFTLFKICPLSHSCIAHATYRSSRGVRCIMCVQFLLLLLLFFRERMFKTIFVNTRSSDSLLVRAPDSRLKGCEFESRQERGDNFFFFFLQSQLFMPPLFDVRSIPVTEVARKRSRLFCQKCRWQVTPKHAYTLDPAKSEWAD